MRRTGVLLVAAAIGVALAGTAGATGDEPALTVRLAPQEATVGDPIEAILEITVPVSDDEAGPGLTRPPRFPTWGETWGEAEILAIDPPRAVSAGAGARLYSQRLVLAAFRPGPLELPPVGVELPYGEETRAAILMGKPVLEVRSVLPAMADGEEEPEPHPADDPEKPGLGVAFGWTVVAMALACLATAYLVSRRDRTGVMANAGVEVDPEALLAESLEALRRESDRERLHTGMSLALRRYFGSRLGFHAVESTTSEIHRQLIHDRLPGPLVRRAAALLAACDQVKFAGDEPARARGEERLEEVATLTDELRGWLAPPEPEESESPAETEVAA